MKEYKQNLIGSAFFINQKKNNKMKNPFKDVDAKSFSIGAATGGIVAIIGFKIGAAIATYKKGKEAMAKENTKIAETPQQKEENTETAEKE